MKNEIAVTVAEILNTYTPHSPEITAGALRDFWLTFDPKSIAGIKSEERQMQETVGIPVPVLQAIGKQVARMAKKQVKETIPLVRTLWEDYGREGRVVAVYPLGAMELVDPKTIVPLILEFCRTCITWEDADQLSMRALEPIIRKDPQQWLPALGCWLEDENKWVRRAGITAVGRLAMKHPDYTARSLEMAADLLYDEEKDVKRAVSFAIRLSARGECSQTLKFMEVQVPPNDLAATWVLCDVIRSMTRKFLPAFKPLLPKFENWVADPDLTPKDRRSIESAILVLKKI